MADNLMFLVNKITGKKALLGKNMGYEWYRPTLDMNDEIDNLFRDPDIRDAFWKGPCKWEIQFEDEMQYKSLEDQSEGGELD